MVKKATKEPVTALVDSKLKRRFVKAVKSNNTDVSKAMRDWIMDYVKRK